MAKVKAPLFSFGASGQLAQSLVFFPFKGLDVVRSYVTPANPNTSAQQTQRSYMTDAVDEWHDAGYTEDDRGAWNRLAGTLKAGLSGFNAFVRNYINEAVAGGTWERMADVVVSGVAADEMTITITKTSGGNAPSVHYGVSPTFMPNLEAMVDQTGNAWEATISSLTPGTAYYFNIQVGTPGTDFGRTGIYLQKTS